MTALSKQELRVWIRSQFKGADIRAKESALLCKHVLESDLFKRARVVGGYMPLPREADVTALLEAALQQGKTLALPLCQEAPVMTMRKVTSVDDLRPGAYGILEPSESAPIISPDEIDLLLVPLEGIDRCGFRLGKGGGYYDRYLSQGNITTIGCALSWQWIDSIPHDPWDQQLYSCADFDEIHWFQQ